MNKSEIHSRIFKIHEHYVNSDNEFEYYNEAIEFFRDLLPSFYGERFISGLVMISNVLKNVDEKWREKYNIVLKDDSKFIFSHPFYGTITEKYQFFYQRFIDIAYLNQKRGYTDSITNTALIKSWNPTLIYDSSFYGALKNKKQFESLPYDFEYIDLKDFHGSDNMKSLYDDLLSNNLNTSLNEKIDDYTYPNHLNNDKFRKSMPLNSEFNFNNFIPAFDLYKVFIALSKNYFNENVLIYYLRPKILHKQYNGLIFLALNAEISIDEYLELESISLRVFSETIKNISEKLAKDAEWKTIVDEMSHSMRHFIGALRSDSSTLKRAGANENKLLFDQTINRMDASIALTADSIDLRYAMKRDSDKSDTHVLDNVKRVLLHQELSLSEVLSFCVDSLDARLEYVGFVDDDTIEILRKYQIPTLREAVEKSTKNIFIKTCKIMIYEVISDLLSNAARYAHYKHPSIQIQFEKGDDSSKLHFINNQSMKREAFDFIEKDIQSPGWSKDTKKGMSNVKNLVNYLGENPQFKWECHVDPFSIDETKNFTDIYLVIPNRYIYESTK